MASEKKGSAKPASEKQESREGKLYNLRSSAQRSAKEDGLTPNQFEIVAVKKNGKEFFKYVYTEAYRSMKEQMAPEPTGPDIQLTPEQEAQAHAAADKAAEPPPQTSTATPTLETKIGRQLTPDEQYRKDMAEIAAIKRAEEEKKPLVVDVPVASGQPPITTTTPSKPAPSPLKCSACGDMFPDKAAFQKHAQEKHGVKPKGKDSWLHKSEIESPTKAVWAIADEMKAANPKISRKEVIAECERRGIAHWTARTQYQAWLTANRESEANAAKANGNHKK